jgi:predicted HAD superfamily Cof-like phosphohydrolase
MSAEKREQVRIIVGETVGESSLCWAEPPTAVFDTAHAVDVVDRTVARLRPYMGLASAESDVREFMVKAGQDTPSKPTMPPLETRILRVKLIAEELVELAEAYGLALQIEDTSRRIGPPDVTVTPYAAPHERPLDLVEAYDGYLDLLVVTLGGMLAQGTAVEPGWAEVHRSNLSKFIDGHRRDDGKWVKGPSYSPADLKFVVDTLCQNC